MNLATIDWVVLIGYLLAMAGIGLYVGWKVRDTESYFLGKRRFSKWLMIGQSTTDSSHSPLIVLAVMRRFLPKAYRGPNLSRLNNSYILASTACN